MNLLCAFIGSLFFSFIVCSCAPTVKGPEKISGEIGVSLAPVRISATNNPESYAATGLPEGISVTNSKTGEISGTPLRAGVFDARISATNQSGTGSKDIKVEVTKLNFPVVWEKELFITHRNVLQNTRATREGGPWHFSTVMRRLAGTADKKRVSEFTLAWLREWGAGHHVVNDDPAHLARNRVETTIIKPWIDASPGGAEDLDWSKAPFRLIGIVNRIDLTKFDDPDTLKPDALGEARLVFGEKNGGLFFAIFEFGIPGEKTKENLIRWARRWRVLGDPAEFGAPNEFGEKYLAQLQTITDDYVTRDGIRKGQVRTNERFVGFPWELREFKLSGDKLTQVVVAQTPQIRFNSGADRQVLLNYLNRNTDEILRHQHKVPPSFEGRAFAAGVSPFPNDQSNFKWLDPGLTDPRKEAIRFGFSFNTCAGCHGGDGKGQGFVHIGNEDNATNQNHLSPFLREEILSFDENGNEKRHNEREIRKRVLARLAAGENVQSALRQYRMKNSTDLLALFKRMMAERVSRVH